MLPLQQGQQSSARLMVDCWGGTGWKALDAKRTCWYQSSNGSYQQHGQPLSTQGGMHHDRAKPQQPAELAGVKITRAWRQLKAPPPLPDMCQQPATASNCSRTCSFSTEAVCPLTLDVQAATASSTHPAATQHRVASSTAGAHQGGSPAAEAQFQEFMGLFSGHAQRRRSAATEPRQVS